METLLVSADEHLRSGRYVDAEQAIDAVTSVLTAQENGLSEPFEAHPLAWAHFEIAAMLVGLGYRPQRIHVQSADPLVEVTLDTADLISFGVDRVDGQWEVGN
jgi:hypothetical protein